MTSNVKLDPGDIHNLCNEVSAHNEHVQCLVCNKSFYAICPNVCNDDKLATKTTVTNYLLSSTKKNFSFLCDICLTNFERNAAESDACRINTLETNMTIMNGSIGELSTQLLEIKKLLTPTAIPVKEKAESEQQPATNSIWFNNERLKKVRASTGPSVLVVSKTNDEQRDTWIMM